MWRFKIQQKTVLRDRRFYGEAFIILCKTLSEVFFFLKKVIPSPKHGNALLMCTLSTTLITDHQLSLHSLQTQI